MHRNYTIQLPWTISEQYQINKYSGIIGLKTIPLFTSQKIRLKMILLLYRQRSNDHLHWCILGKFLDIIKKQVMSSKLLYLLTENWWFGWKLYFLRSSQSFWNCTQHIVTKWRMRFLGTPTSSLEPLKYPARYTFWMILIIMNELFENCIKNFNIEWSFFRSISHIK